MRPGITILALVAWLAVLGASPASGQVLAPPFAGSYVLNDLGAPQGVPINVGGLTLKAGTTDRLLIGGAAAGPDGALYEIGVTRDPDGHIIGFSGAATRFAEAANVDGGVTYGPGGVLFFTRYDLNHLGQIRAGSDGTDKNINLGDHGVAPSVGALMFVPAGHPGGGSLKLASFTTGQWYDADVFPDGNGTYDLAGVTAVQDAVIPGGPEGIVYVNPGSSGFVAPSVLVSEWAAGTVGAYSVDSNGDPIVSTRRDFVTGLVGAEGAFLDPVTGDFLFSTYEGGNRVIVVRGFARPATLSVITDVVNDDGGTNGPGDFNVHVRSGGDDVDGSPQPGSASGSLYTLTAGTPHTVAADAVPGYTLSVSGNCAADGSVTPEEGVQQTCTITADDIPPGTLNVVTQVAGGGWLAQDFTVHLRTGGLDAPGSPQPGSVAGTPYSLPAGTYVVSAAPARGYVATIGGDCAADGSVALASEQTRTCTITNSAVPLGPGRVVESYGESRTDSEWGLTESFLEPTRAYLADPANFGPSGTVARALQVAPGISVANARTLAGVDVFFTGWVPTGSYTSEEREALHDFVLGGGTLIATTDDTGHTMVDVFGLEQGDGGGSPTVNTITDLDHPIASGPFGAVTTFNQYDATGHYPTLPSTAHEVGRNAQGTSLAVIEAGALGPGSGAAIFVADVDVFSISGGAFDNPTLIKNLFAFAAGERTLDVSDVTRLEGNAGSAAFTFTVGLPAPSASPVRVHYATADDTAAAPSDYTAAAGDLEFAPGQTTKTVSITVNGDGDVEADERFRVNLSGASGAGFADAQGIGTIVNDDSAPQNSQPQLPPPVPGKQVNALPAQGTVKVKLPGSNRFVELTDDRQVPVGTVIDTLKGRVTLVAASNRSGGTATAAFYDGIFKLGQTRNATPTTMLTLVEKLSCPKRGKASAAAKKKKRKLWGDGSGRFRTGGSYSSATVRGTKWLVQDSCTSTLTKVTRGSVTVRDFVKKKTVIVKARKQYVARRR